MYKTFRIVKPEEYTTKTGEKKTSWNSVGKYIEISDENGENIKRFIEIPAIGLKASVFENTEDKEKTPQTTEKGTEDNNQQKDETEQVTDIPF